MRAFVAALLGAALIVALAACQPDQIPPAPTATANVATPVSVAGGRLVSTPGPTPTPAPTPSPTITPVPTATPTEVPVIAPGKRPSIGLVTSVDRDPRWRAARDAAERVGREAGVAVADVAGQPGDTARNAMRLADAGYDVVIVAAYNVPLGEWLAGRYPLTHFVVFGQLPDPAPANLSTLTFGEEEAGFLAGALAGWLTQRDLVAFVGGAPTEDVVKYRKGYEHGVRYVNSKAVVLGAYLDSFAAPEKGAEEARAQLAEGADILFAAGGTTAQGALEAVAGRGVAVIAAEVDPYSSLGAAAPLLASTAIVQIDQGIADVIRAAKHGALKSEMRSYGVAAGTVRLGPYHEWESRIPVAAKDQLANIQTGLQKGTIKTGVEIPVY